ncbi:MAG: GNAT family N-acetyltransferase [Acidimicrobiales bacterium]
MVQLSHVRQTSRLTLRRFTLDDLDDLALILANEDVNRYLYTAPRDRAATLEVLQGFLAKTEETSDVNSLSVAVELRDTKRVIGEFLLWWTANEHRQGEIGGSLHPDFHRQGFASEVYEELLALAFTQYGLRRVVGRCDGRNVPSVRSLEKAGLHQEAHFVENEFVKGEWTDEIVMAIRKDEWERRR